MGVLPVPLPPAGTVALDLTGSPGHALVRLGGEIDLDIAPALGRAVQEARRAGHRHLDVDLAEVTFIDSTGIAVLLNEQGEGLHLAVVGMSAQVRRVFHLTGLDGWLGAA